MKTDYFINALPAKTAELLSLFQKTQPEFLNNFYLSGGTALSLLLGHRESEDLDWFNQQGFDPIRLQPKLEMIGRLSLVELDGKLKQKFSLFC